MKKSDQIDKLFAKHFAEHDLDIELQKISEGKYKFGNKLITAKVVNDRLRIRHETGYVSFETFLNYYNKKIKDKPIIRRSTTNLMTPIKI